jgi:hypothetical protein
MATLTNRSQTFMAAAALGVAAGALPLIAPTGLIEAVVVRSHVGDLLHAAQPPLGMTARLTLAAGFAVAMALFFVMLMTLLERDRRLRHRRARAARSADEDAPALRRGDTHPDAPARRPLSAQDLPFELEVPLPEETAPSEPEVVAEPAVVLDPVADAQPASAPEPEPDSIEALMARIERKIEERGGRPPPLPPATVGKVDLQLREMMNNLHRAAANRPR